MTISVRFFLIFDPSNGSDPPQADGDGYSSIQRLAQYSTCPKLET